MFKGNIGTITVDMSQFIFWKTTMFASTKYYGSDLVIVFDMIQHEVNQDAGGVAVPVVTPLSSPVRSLSRNPVVRPAAKISWAIRQ